MVGHAIPVGIQAELEVQVLDALGDAVQVVQLHAVNVQSAEGRDAIADGLVYIPDFTGFLHCLDLQSGKSCWTYDALAAVWGSPLVADGKVYLGDEDGDLAVLQAGKDLKVLSEISMGSAVYSTPVAANGVLYVMTRQELYAIAN